MRMFDPIKEQKKMLELWESNFKTFDGMFPKLEVEGGFFDFLTKPQQVIDYCKDVCQKICPRIEMDEEFIDKLSEGNMDDYVDFFTQAQEQYEETLGKLVNKMNLGINLEAMDEQQKAMDAYCRLIFSTGKLAAMMAKNNIDSGKNIMENYNKMVKEGKSISKFTEYYDLWYSTNEKNLIALFSTESFSKAFGDFSDKYFKYISANNAVLERYLSKLPIPTNKDMNSLYLTVYTLRKDVRDLKKEVEKLTEKACSKVDSDKEIV